MPTHFSLSRLLWCVRTTEYLHDVERASDLLVVPLGATLVAFVAESLPGAIMRGVPRQEWEGAHLDDTAVHNAADRNTSLRFRNILERLPGESYTPRDGWSFTGDVLFGNSCLMVAQLRQELHMKSRGDVLFAAPEQSVAMAIPATAATEEFARRVRRTYRESMSPCSDKIVVYDGTRLADWGRG